MLFGGYVKCGFTVASGLGVFLGPPFGVSDSLGENQKCMYGPLPGTSIPTGAHLVIPLSNLKAFTFNSCRLASTTQHLLDHAKLKTEK